MDFKILFEVIGYCGTILVVLSMMMTSVVKLRIINICGSILSMTYAVITNTWPIVLMNAALIIINVIQLIRSFRRSLNFNYRKVLTNDLSFKHFMEIYKFDIEKYFGEISISDNEEAYLVYIDTELAGVLVGNKENDCFNVSIDYAIPKFRDMSIGKYVYPKLKEYDINLISQSSGVKKHNKYLLSMGYVLNNNYYIKKL
jgi:hypothetical protein